MSSAGASVLLLHTTRFVDSSIPYGQHVEATQGIQHGGQVITWEFTVGRSLYVILS